MINQKLTPEQIIKMNADLETITTLSNFAQSNHCVLEIDGGYATEAYFGGRITRPHGDIDAVLWIADPSLELDAQQQIKTLLEKESTRWELYPSNGEHFIEMREPTDSRPLEERRRIELYTYDKKRMRQLEPKILIDSKGQKHQLMVTSLVEIIAFKISKTALRFKQGEKGRAEKKVRATNQTDIEDLKRLLAHSKFSKEKYIEYFKNTEKHLSDNEAIQEAEKTWNLVMQLIGA